MSLVALGKFSPWFWKFRLVWREYSFLGPALDMDHVCVLKEYVQPKQHSAEHVDGDRFINVRHVLTKIWY